MERHNPYVECPYNKAHQVPKLRLQYHLVKCRKQYPSTEMKTCPYNATHIMPEQELKLHFSSCSDRSLIEGQKYNYRSAEHGDLGNPSFHPEVPKEDWENCNRQRNKVFYPVSAESCYESSSSRDTKHDSRQSTRFAPNTRVDEYCPGGALGISKNIMPVNGDRNLSTASSVGKSFIGLGRGRINIILAQMVKNSGS